jgi:hypothetical protein
VYIDGIAHAMSLSSGTASDGIYSFSTTLQAGTHAYYFSFNDGYGGMARLPFIDAYAGPFVNHSPVLTSAAMSPASGTTATTFIYNVYYSDPDGQAPSTRSVFIDGIEHAMSFASGQAPSNGIYTFQTTLPAGTHTYFFSVLQGSLVQGPLQARL